MTTTSTSAVVTGAARGIGRGIAVELVRAGHAVVVTDLDGEAARSAAAEIGAVAGLAHDVRDPQGHRDVAAEAQRHGRLAVWVNNAGVAHDGTIEELDDDQVRRLVEVNLLGVLWGCRAALDAFDGTGDIVTVASLSGHGPAPGLSVYGATKAAVVALTSSMAVELPRGVRVHALCPDGVATALVEAMRPDGRARELVNAGGRLLTVEEVAAAAVALVGGRRVVQTMPVWRGVMLRVGSLAPRLSVALEPMVRWEGRRAMRRAAQRSGD